MMKITLKRVEGPSDQVNHFAVVSTFSQANEVLRRWSDSAPKVGYDKCEFSIGKHGRIIDYVGRYDLQHWSCGTADLKAHVERRLARMTGIDREHFADLISEVA